MASAVASLCAMSIACGGSGSDRPELNVAVASSLKRPFTELANRYADADLRLEATGSDKIAAALESGRRPDLVVLAGGDLPAGLHRKGLIGPPVVVARNRLVIAARPGGPKIDTPADLGKPGTRLALGSPTVPVGAYADRLIARLPAPVRAAIEANVRTREPDAAGVVGKLLLGSVDAAIVYRTDVLAAGGKLRETAIPARFEPEIDYLAAVVEGVSHQREAGRLLASLRKGEGSLLLHRGGFLPPKPN